MDDDIKRFGSKIIRESEWLADKVTQMHDSTPSEINHQKYKHWVKMLFLCLGNALCKENNHSQEQIKVWSNIFEDTQIAEIPLHETLATIFHTRAALLDLLDHGTKNNELSSNSVFQIIKEIDPLLDYASHSITSFCTKSLLNTKITLSETNEDLNITLREMKDFKVALNEATIFTITDPNDQITYVNDRFCNITQYSREELIGKSHGDILNSGYHSDDFIKKIQEDIHNGVVWKGEICNKAKDGSLYWVDVTIVPFLDKEGKAYQHISIQYDITEKKRTEEMLLKSEKLSLVGELAAGLAHEIRNPLTTVKGLVQILQSSTEEKRELYTDIILDEINRINLIVSEFMVLAKPHAVYFSELNVTDILKTVIYLLEAEANLKNVVFMDDFSVEEAHVFGEKNQLTQVFINLFKNAMEALPHGGIIRVRTRRSGDNIVLSIEDNGVGMDEEQVKRIGEPFYTTKETGTGLGLMVSYRIIQNHKGSMTVQSELNKGTSFNISLPIFNGQQNKLEEKYNEV
ncbi:ATP-binding protein [Fictibacillus barbaricus]|uniref:histidine kinase n=1 Tax=Fictibacillus barbaricus TaxID=182136 RepID=A0ABU1TWI8_9BACL|nr:ATP-binding protein [Fictibacillus barbaricus]MDR7071540.1 PAS domain S-box-containing protein [Fictibacillus barbaricus]